LTDRLSPLLQLKPRVAFPIWCLSFRSLPCACARVARSEPACLEPAWWRIIRVICFL
jgi:hypothetical protein